MLKLKKIYYLNKNNDHQLVKFLTRTVKFNQNIKNYQSNVRPFESIPGPNSYPFIGSMLSIKGFGRLIFFK